MQESDLRAHLSRQTSKKIGLFDVLRLDGQDGSIEKRFRELLDGGAEVVLFDVLYDRQLIDIGRLVWKHADRRAPLFAVGSSGLEHALTSHWNDAGWPAEPLEFETPGPAEQLVAVSGSCSPVTERQIACALEHGFTEVPLDPTYLTSPEEENEGVEAAVAKALRLLAAGSSVILHTCRGPRDPRIKAASLQFEAIGYEGLEAKLVSGRLLGEALGRILQRILECTDLRRAVVAGGDTSGYVAGQLDIEALKMVAHTAPGSPLCRVYSPRGDLDDLEIIFKGGQVGWQDFFVSALRGMKDNGNR